MSNQKPSKHGHPIDIEMEEALRAIGFTPSEIDEGTPQGVVIFKYTRRQAIEDGVLIDVSDLARQAGFRLHTAVTFAVYGELTRDLDKMPSNGANCAPTIIFGMLRILHREIVKDLRAGKQADRIDFATGVIKMWASVGPGDEGEPVLTIMLLHED